MWQQGFHRLVGSGLLTLAAALAAPTQASSELSRWLSQDIVPKIRTLLSEHPRYQQQRIKVQAGDPSGLSDTLVSALNNTLQGSDGITLVRSEQPDPTRHATSGSVDELTCSSRPDFDYLLQASVARGKSGHDQVTLTLLETYPAMEQINSWQWRGRFSTAERKQAENVLNSSADGSLSAPWRDQDVDAAALALSRDFACALRPQIKNRLRLHWPQDSQLPPVFADTSNATRHRLGNFRELGISSDQAEYAVTARVERFRDNIWQLWITGSPLHDDLAPVQAVAYIETGAVPTETALKFIDVQMLDAAQADKGRSRADLLVTLRIGNRANRPIAYSFSLSGGHYENCVARPAYYRHDHYGLLQGTLAAGEIEVRRLVIKNARHNPAPVWGTARCAGFRDLAGFEEFASQGYKVTDYVRWDM